MLFHAFLSFCLWNVSLQFVKVKSALQFLNGPRIAQLCAYLELVHQKGMAVDQHTNLLLGAYVKTNAVEKIVDFVEKSATPPFNTLDIDAAVKVGFVNWNLLLSLNLIKLQCRWSRFFAHHNSKGLP